MAGVGGKYKAYPEYKDSGVESMGTIPSAWGLVRAKNIFSIKKRIAGELGFDILSITQKGVKKKDIESGEGQLSMDYSKYQLVFAGDFAMNHMDLLTGYVDISPFNGVTSPDYRVFNIENTKDYVPEYYLYLLQNGYRQKLFFHLGQGSAHLGRWRLPTEAFNEILYPKPTKREQELIASFLDHETAKIDTLIEEQKTLIRLLQEKRQAVISHVVTKGLNPDAPMKDSGVEWLGEVPEHWIVRRLKHVADLQSGIPKGKDLAGKITIEVPMLRVANVQDGYLKLNEVHKIHIEPDQLERYELKKGDVLMNEGGDNDKLGRGAVWKGEIAPCIHQNHVFAIRPKDIEPEWLALLTGSSYAKFHFYRVAKQSTNLASISSSNIKETPLVIPPFEERRAIIDHLKTLMKKYDAIEAQGQDQVRLLTERRTALISAAITGKIDVRDWKPTAHPQQKHPEAPHEQTA
ncbi:restriction endonuclease subunit S [Endozoicomonas sp. ALC013]|uniref:restriction endonuclease subunit S n=1 Tax=Endozoicomonas sp. ALC013 TaxID=3403076 RepID=UPI003BB53D5F